MARPVGRDDVTRPAVSSGRRLRGGRRRGARPGVAILGPAGAAPVTGRGRRARRSRRRRPTRSSRTKGVVHVTVDVTATNNKPNLVQRPRAGRSRRATSTTRPGSPIHAEATAIRASAGKASARRRRSSADDGFTVVEVSFRSDLQYKQSTTVPGRLRPARRGAALRQRHPGRVGVRDVLRLGVRRPRRRPDRHPGRLRGRDDRLDDRRVRRGRRHDAYARPGSPTRTSGTPSSSPTGTTR